MNRIRKGTLIPRPEWRQSGGDTLLSLTPSSDGYGGTFGISISCSRA